MKFFIEIIITLLSVKCFAANKRPNIVMIVADDLGWADVGIHGSRQVKTPNIDLLAANGIKLDNYYVSPVCSPTRSALMSGYHPIHTGLQHNAIENGQPYGIPLRYWLLPKFLKGLGYKTHAVGKWHLGFFQRGYLPTYRGFDSHFGYYSARGDYWSRVSFMSNVSGIDFRDNETPVPIEQYAGIYSTDLYTAKAVDIIREATKPLFLYLAHQAPHVGNPDKPLQAPQRYIERFAHISDYKRRTYLAMLSALDDSVGKVVSALQLANILNETIIIFTTENGGAIPSRHGIAPDLDFDSIGSNWPLRGAKTTLFEGGVRGFAFIWSTQLKRKYNSNHLMHIQDWLPTIYSAVGSDPRHLGPLDGIDMWNVLMNNGVGPRKRLLHNIDDIWKVWALRDGDYKLVFGSGVDTTDRYNYWYLPPDEAFSESVDTNDYNKSLVYKVLRKINYNIKDVKKSVIQCNRAVDNVVCNPGVNPCLFDLRSDPCEYDNLFDRLPNIVHSMLQQLVRYNASAVPALNPPLDPRANPIYHGNYWSPWL